MRLSADEVGKLNEITQVCASGFLFYRGEKPEIAAALVQGEHRQFHYQDLSRFDPLLDELSQHYRWGTDGADGISGPRTYCGSLEGNR